MLESGIRMNPNTRFFFDLSFISSYKDHLIEIYAETENKLFESRSGMIYEWVLLC